MSAPSSICRVVTPKSGRLVLADWSLDSDTGQFDEVVCELPEYPGWRILVDVQADENGLALRRLVVEPAAEMPSGGITTRLLRDLHTGELIAALRAAARQAKRYVGVEVKIEKPNRVGRRGREDLYYAEVAAAYVDALGNTPHAAAHVASANHLSPSQLRNLLTAARKRGLLTDAPKGRPGGELTPLAKRLLSESMEAKS